MTLTAAVALIALFATTMTISSRAAPPIAGIDVPPPLPPVEFVDRYWGQAIPDPWQHLENLRDPVVQSWLRGQADATQEILNRIPGRAALMKRVQEIDGEASSQVGGLVRVANGGLFYMRRNPDEEQFKIARRSGPEAAEEVVLDPRSAAHGGGPKAALMDWQPSPDGRRLAYSLQVAGAELGTLHVIDVATGRALMAPTQGVRYPTVSWRGDSSGFFYTRLRDGYAAMPRAERQLHLQRHYRVLDRALDRTLDTEPDDRIVLSASRAPELQMPEYAHPGVFEVPGTELAAVWVGHGVEPFGALALAPMKDVLAGSARWHRVVGRADEVTAAAIAGDGIYLLSTRNAPRGQVLRLPLDAPDLASATVLVPQSEGVIVAIAAARDALYLTRREGVQAALYRLPHDIAAATTRSQPKLHAVAFPAQGRVILRHSHALQDGVLVMISGWTLASRGYAYEPAQGEGRALRLGREGRFDVLAGYVAREVMVSGHDGAKIPMSLVMREGLPRDGRNPTMLFGYGAYGIPNDPMLNPQVLAWLERGGIFAVAHVRGGGSLGREWHEAGKKQTKPNTWKDAISLAQWLVDERWTQPARLGIWGGSAGGILVGRAIIERPDLFAAAVPAVGVMDTLRAERMPGGSANVPEFGTVANEQDFPALLAMSSYHQLREGLRLPAVMLIHGVNDNRVDLWQSAKFASRLASLASTNQPVLLNLDYDAGHGQGSTRAQSRQQMVDIWSFMLWQFGVMEFQPKAP
jgi:prolyl oligopeptidase